jgi:hypothetical protein
MNKKFATTALAGLLLAASAYANTITINAGESPTFPPTFSTLATGSSPLILAPTACCGVSNSFIIAASAIGTPPLPNGQLDTDTITVSTTGAGTLFIWITEQGITAPPGTVNVTSGLTANLINGAITNVALSTFLSPTNSVSPPNGNLLDTNAFTAIGTQSNTVSMLENGTYSLQSLYVITATGAGNANLTIDLAANNVPEPATFGLFGGALVVVGLLRRKRQRLK